LGKITEPLLKWEATSQPGRGKEKRRRMEVWPHDLPTVVAVAPMAVGRLGSCLGLHMIIKKI